MLPQKRTLNQWAGEHKMTYIPRRWMLFAWLACAGSVATWAGTRQAGLWELTTTTTWQKSPSIPGSDGEQLQGGTHTRQVCLTQEMIDKYAALLPQSRGHCALANKVVNPGTITADYVCNGIMSGKGDLVSKWSDSEHSKSSVHFVGTFRVGAGEQPVEWTTESTAVFKGQDCGAVKPPSLPLSQR